MLYNILSNHSWRTWDRGWRGRGRSRWLTPGQNLFLSDLIIFIFIFVFVIFCFVIVSFLGMQYHHWEAESGYSEQVLLSFWNLVANAQLSSAQSSSAQLMLQAGNLDSSVWRPPSARSTTLTFPSGAKTAPLTSPVRISSASSRDGASWD